MVLHVEDDPNDALLLRHACRKAGVAFELRAVADGDEAIAYLREAQRSGDQQKYPLPGLLLLDLKMPRLSGFDVLAWVRQEERLKELPVIILSSSSQQTDIQRAYDLGANSYLLKPVGFDALVELVQTIYGHWVSHTRKEPPPRPVP